MKSVRKNYVYKLSGLNQGGDFCYFVFDRLQRKVLMKAINDALVDNGKLNKSGIRLSHFIKVFTRIMKKYSCDADVEIENGGGVAIYQKIGSSFKTYGEEDGSLKLIYEYIGGDDLN